MASPSEERLIRNEKILRDQNRAAGRGIKKYFRNNRLVQQAPIAFACECSSLDCKKQIMMSIETYEKLQRREDRFVIYPGHQTPAVEKISGEYKNYVVVEKFAVQP